MVSVKQGVGSFIKDGLSVSEVVSQGTTSAPARQLYGVSSSLVIVHGTVVSLVPSKAYPIGRVGIIPAPVSLLSETDRPVLGLVGLAVVI